MLDVAEQKKVCILEQNVQMTSKTKYIMKSLSKLC